MISDPGARKLRAIFRRLRSVYGLERHGNLRDIFWELVFIVISVRTSEAVYRRTFASLRRRYATIEALGAARLESLETILRPTGLAGLRSGQLRFIAREFVKMGSAATIKRRARRDPVAFENYLCTLRGVGRKVAKCVMMYAADVDVLPVDAHVWRVMSRLGYAPGGRLTVAKSLALEARVPQGLRYDVHVICISHGRRICKATPHCDICPVRSLCPSSLAG